jgi:hypothetical protein
VYRHTEWVYIREPFIFLLWKFSRLACHRYPHFLRDEPSSLFHFTGGTRCRHIWLYSIVCFQFTLVHIRMETKRVYSSNSAPTTHVHRFSHRTLVLHVHATGDNRLSYATSHTGHASIQHGHRSSIGHDVNILKSPRIKGGPHLVSFSVSPHPTVFIRQGI